MVNMHIRLWIISWIISFLECRKQSTLYNGTLSDIKFFMPVFPKGHALAQFCSQLWLMIYVNRRFTITTHT